MSTTLDPHAGQSVLASGAALTDARLVAILLHGRGASAEDILGLASDLRLTDVAYLAPQAAGNTWYPYSFLTPMEKNEPSLSSALGTVAALVAHLGELGVSPERVALMGFSQGACLALEFAVRHPRRYGGVVGLSGGLIGPPGTTWTASSSFEGTPVFLGCSDVDFHIPKERVIESAAVLRGLGADVTTVLYPNMDHTVNDDEMTHLQALVDRLLA